jgi:ketosteroid isomerase-like protein
MSTATLTDNAATVGKLYQAFGQGDIAYILNMVADNCKWIGAGEGSLPQGGTYIGKDASNFFKRLLDAEEFTAFNPQAIHNIGDREVVAFGTMTAKSRITGKPSSSDWVMHWRFDAEGKVVYFQDFFDTAAAYRANQ